MKTAQLQPAHLDALREIGRAAGTAAAANLAKLAGTRVELGVTEARVASIIDATRIVGDLPARTSVACMRIDGDVSGDLLLIMPAPIERVLVGLLGVDRRDVELRSSAIRELANIMLGGWLMALEAATGLVATPGPPILGDGDPEALLAPSIARAASDDDAVPSIDAALTLADEGLPRGAIHVLLLPAPGSLHRILDAHRSRPAVAAAGQASDAGARAELSVHMGELVISSRAGDVLIARGLGSCIGLVLIDPTARIAVLAHVMLPVAPSRMQLGGRPTWPARYADRAVESGLEAIVAAGGAAARVEAWMAGGAQMFEGVLDTDQLQTGMRNAEGVRRALCEHGIRLVREDAGGSVGRTLEVDVATLAVTCRIPMDGRSEQLRAPS